MTYLDNAATTQPKFRRADYKSMSHAWMNANANHKAQRDMDNARQQIKNSLGVCGGKVLFVKSSTEAVQFLAKSLRKRYAIYCSRYDHDSVWDMRDTVIGDNITYQNSIVILTQLVNQMTGSVQDIVQLLSDYGDCIAYLGLDLTATIGKYSIPKWFENYVSACWFDAHKFGGEGNIGALWVSDDLFKELGGTEDSRNEYGLIHGSPDVEGAIMLADAFSFAVGWTHSHTIHYHDLSIYLMSKLQDGDYLINKTQEKIYGINAIYLNGVDADALQMFLSTKDIYIGKGASACADAKDYRVLNAYGLSNAEANHVIRVSFCPETTKNDINTLICGIRLFREMYC